MSDAPDVSVVIPALNAAGQLPALLEGLRAAIAEAPERVEIIVADNGSTDGTASIAEAAGARVIRAATPGPAAARNAGMREARGALILLIDADCVPARDWIAVWCRAFAEDPRLDLAGGDLEDAETETLVGLYTAYHGILEARRFAAGSPTRPGFFVTANFAIRRAALERLGGFDETMDPAGEDADLCWRADELGMTRRFVPQCRARHHHRTSLRGLARQMYKYGLGSAAVQAKWGRKKGFRVELDWRTWLRIPKALLKLVAAPFRFPRHWRRAEGILDLVRYTAFLAGRWRGAAKYRVLCL